MPELPEVETIKRELEPHVVGRTVTDVRLDWEGIVRLISPEEFRKRLIGQKIIGLVRNGKYLSFKLASGETLVAHLKMSGALLLDGKQPDERFVRAVITFDNGLRLFFRDPRKFGRLWLVTDDRTVTGKLGPEPLEPAFTVEALADILRKRNGPIKALLIDQTLIAGIGNMYADEALFAAKIHPIRPGSSLIDNEIQRLHRAIKEVLRQAIGDKGASVVNYYRPGGELGTAHFRFKVAHRRGGEPCDKCGTPIKRITVRGRGTYFCPKCQKNQ